MSTTQGVYAGAGTLGEQVGAVWQEEDIINAESSLGQSE
jgi:hypothetical protein